MHIAVRAGAFDGAARLFGAELEALGGSLEEDVEVEERLEGRAGEGGVGIAEGVEKDGGDGLGGEGLRGGGEGWECWR